MNFQRGRGREEPEINLIPLIDVLLVVIIFLMLTTTYARYSALEITLPTADAEQKQEKPNEITVAVTAAGQIVVGEESVKEPEVGFIREALIRAAAGQTDPLILISADAKATHQSVIDVMQAAQQAGFARISFATQSGQ
jgi:biopolymer transport protein ExbD